MVIFIYYVHEQECVCNFFMFMTRAGYPSAPHDWLRRCDFSTTEMPDSFDIETDRVEDAQQQEHNLNEARKTRIEDATARYRDLGMQYSKTYERAHTEELTRSEGRVKRTRTFVTVAPS